MNFVTLPNSGEFYLIAYFVALALSFGLTLALIKIIRGNNFFTSLLNGLTISAGKSVSPFGGVPVILSFLATLWLLLFLGMMGSSNVDFLNILTVGVGLMCLLGVYDDITNCPPKVKLFIQVGIACILYFAGFQIEHIGSLIDLGPFSILLTIFSNITIASSTTIPIANTSAIKVKRLIEKSNMYIDKKVEIKDTGNAIKGTIRALMLPRNK